MMKVKIRIAQKIEERKERESGKREISNTIQDNMLIAQHASSLCSPPYKHNANIKYTS